MTPRLAAILTLIWVGVITACMLLGRRLGPWLNGVGRPYLLASLVAAFTLSLLYALLRLARLPRRERARRALVLLGSGAGVVVLTWLQPLMIERSHVLLYGVAGVLAYLAAGRWAGWPRLMAAAWFCSLVGLADEVAQHLHPQRVGDVRDVLTNALAGSLAAAAAAALLPFEPAYPRHWVRLAVFAWILWGLGLLTLGWATA